MANAFNGEFTALFVKTPFFSAMSEKNKKQLRSNIYLAEQLGAAIETSYGDDAALQISEFARISGVSKIVIGRNNARKKFIFGKPTLTEKLISYAPNLDVYIIPDSAVPSYMEKKIRNHDGRKLLPSDVLKSVAILITMTLTGFCFKALGFSEANTITVFILGVLVTAVITTQRIYSLFLSLMGVVIFNFFFTEPRYTFMAYGNGYPVTFLITFLSAFITSSLAIKLKITPDSPP